MTTAITFSRQIDAHYLVLRNLVLVVVLVLELKVSNKKTYVSLTILTAVIIRTF